MSEENSYKADFGSDAAKAPRRIVFITRKTSAKVTGAVGRHLMSYPHVVLREAIALQILTIILVAIALLWDAPLEQLADPLLTPNPAKAPWYFLGLQELLHYLPPLVAGVIIPTLVIIALIIIPYFKVNVAGAPLWSHGRSRRMWLFLASLLAVLAFCGIYQAWTIIVPTTAVGSLAILSYFIPPGRTRPGDFLRSRALSWWVMTWFIAVAIILTAIGTFFRGPGWSWVWPGR
jgi:hypothetical protein